MADLAASIAHRLLIHARESQQDYNALLTQYALERLLYRLSTSQHASRFLLKGALLFLLWHDLPNRPTRDIDLLAFGHQDVQDIEEVFRDICVQEGEDAVIFDEASVRGTLIRERTSYSGVRVVIEGRLKGIQLHVQVDVAFGDIVTPAAAEEVFPTILHGMPAPRLRVYPKYTVCAEKLQAMTSLGMANTRLKDYYDLWLLLENDGLDPVILGNAIRATFRRRKTLLFTEWPLALTEAFSRDQIKQRQWEAFIQKNRLVSPSLREVIERIQVQLKASLAIARDNPSPLSA